jgi:hypothetical protein
MPDHDPAEAPTTPAPTDRPAVASRDTAEEEFTAFYRATLIPLTGFLVLHGAEPADAADVAHDTLAEAYQRWHTVEHPRAWAFRVAARAWGRRQFRVREDLTPAPPEPSPALRAADIEHWELHLDVVQALRELPPRQRQVMAWPVTATSPPRSPTNWAWARTPCAAACAKRDARWASVCRQRRASHDRSAAI